MEASQIDTKTVQHRRTQFQTMSRDGNSEDEKVQDKDHSILFQLSADERREVYKSQTEAALRRRKEQLRQANFLLNKERVDSHRLHDPHAGPVLRRFSIPRKNDTGCFTSEAYQTHADQHNRPKEKNDIYTSSSHGHYICTKDYQINEPSDGEVIYRSAHVKRFQKNLDDTVQYSEENDTTLLDNTRAPAATDKDGANQIRTSTTISSPLTSNPFDDDAHTENLSTRDRTEHGRPNTAEESKTLGKEIQNKIDANPVKLSIDWEDSAAMKRFVMDPCPKSAGMVQCFVKRNSGMKAKMLPEYRVYLKDGNTFLMTSKKRAKKQSSNYLISLGRNDHDKNSTNMIGKLRSNFLGTEFQIYDNGRNPKTFDPFFDEKNEEVARRELGCILYTSNILGTRGPRKMEVCINKINGNGKSTKDWQPLNNDKEMILHFKGKTEMAREHLFSYENRQPRWNEDMEAYVLNFNKRVTMASVKNFQLIESGEEEERVIMQFGRTGKDEFSMDVQWPMSLFQAFAISLSSCDSKLACD